MQVLKNMFGLNKKIAASEIAVKDEDGTGVTLDDYLKKQGPNVGTAGEDGTTFIPSLSSDGTLSWSNNGGLENPEPVNIKGPQGENGATGPQGAQGVRGETGQDGREIELQVTTTYIQWRYVGDTTWNNLIALSNLKGSKGDQGEQGVQGIQGPKGDTGPQGIQGPAGNDGAKGDTGATGPQGPKGDKGDTGSQGPKGDTGSTGLQGPQGEAGQDGEEVQLRATSTYIQWKYTNDTTWENLISLSSLKGEKGDTGPQGIQGPKGETGATGATGLQGEKGNNGKDGVTPNITVGTTTTLAAGSSATVTKRGTTENPIFDFGIPKGADGNNATGLTQIVLYENSSGFTSSTTFENIEGLKFIDIFYKSNFGDAYVDFKRVNIEHCYATTISTVVPIIYNYYYNGINYQIFENLAVIINGSIIGIFCNSNCQITTTIKDGSQTFDTSTYYIYFTKVVGYK